MLLLQNLTMRSLIIFLSAKFLDKLSVIQFSALSILVLEVRLLAILVYQILGQALSHSVARTQTKSRELNLLAIMVVILKLTAELSILL